MPRSFQKPLPPAEPGASPVNAVPPVILVLVLVVAVVEGAASLGALGVVGGPAAIGWRAALIERFAVSPTVLDYALHGHAELLPRFVLYAFVQGSAVHAAFGAALLLALGKFVAEGMGQARALSVFLVATVVGGFVFGAVLSGAQPLLGPYPGIYGLIGAFTYLLWLRLGRTGGSRIAAFRMIGSLMAIQLMFGVLFGANPHWVADLGGFVSGGLTAIAVAPGGPSALLARLRTR
jgi:membrane associated rhomboid family serine protease